jgi:hypothetical protein
MVFEAEAIKRLVEEYVIPGIKERMLEILRKDLMAEIEKMSWRAQSAIMPAVEEAAKLVAARYYAPGGSPHGGAGHTIEIVIRDERTPKP